MTNKENQRSRNQTLNAITFLLFEPGRQNRSKSWIHRNYICPCFGIGYRTYLRSTPKTPVEDMEFMESFITHLGRIYQRGSEVLAKRSARTPPCEHVAGASRHGGKMRPTPSHDPHHKRYRR